MFIKCIRNSITIIINNINLNIVACNELINCFRNFANIKYNNIKYNNIKY